MDVVFTRRARSDLIAIGAFVDTDKRNAAVHLVNTIVDVLVHQLSQHPNSGRPGRVEGTRELIVHSSYVAVYKVSQHTVTVLTVRHTARQWPMSF